MTRIMAVVLVATGEIGMDENAVLGPVDPQLGAWPAASVLAVLEQKDTDKVEAYKLMGFVRSDRAEAPLRVVYALALSEARQT